MDDFSFIDVKEAIPTIHVECLLAYSHNFLGRPIYPIPVCFLRRPVANRLARVQDYFLSLGLSLKITDGYRPHSIQKILWEFLPDPRFVADPKIGSKHSRGAAVDVTLVDPAGNELKMPTKIDEFSPKCRSDYMQAPPEELANRALLHEGMKREGFIPLPGEWWHFDDRHWQQFPIEDLSLPALCGLSPQNAPCDFGCDGNQ